MSNKIKILLLDDEPIVVERVKQALEKSNYLVSAFVSGKKAIDHLRKEKVDILITDLKMSSPDGMDVLKTARQLHPDIKSIVISGFATFKTAEEARKSGALEFIAKPFRISQLKKLLLKITCA